jgi:hypothetical protein
MNLKLFGIALLTTVCTWATPGSAQESQHRLLVDLEIGAGASRVSCNQCEQPTRHAGPAIGVGLGYRPGAHWGILLKAEAWRRDSDGIRSTLVSVAPRVYLRPGSGHRSELYAGAGLGYFESGPGAAKATGVGPLVQAGIAYEIPLSTRLLILPTISYSHAWIGNARYRGAFLAGDSLGSPAGPFDDLQTSEVRVGLILRIT